MFVYCTSLADCRVFANSLCTKETTLAYKNRVTVSLIIQRHNTDVTMLSTDAGWTDRRLRVQCYALHWTDKYSTWQSRDKSELMNILGRRRRCLMKLTVLLR